MGVGLGAVALGGYGQHRSPPRYTHYTYASDGDLDDRRLRVAWYERYNGRFVESQGGSKPATVDAALDAETDPEYLTEATLVTEASGPVVTVGNVLPGDEGALVVGLETVDSEDFLAEPLDIWLRAALTVDDEGVHGEPETTDGDTTPIDGELDEELFVDIWRDGSPLGSCNGRREFGETFERPIVDSMTLGTAFAPTSGVGGGVRVFRALDPGVSRCLALGWSFPAASTNRSQNDSVGFALTFVGIPVGADNPFASGEGE